MVVLTLTPDSHLAEWPIRGDVIIADVEYTAWEGSMARGWCEPWEYREIIQIGAVRLGALEFAETDAFEVLVKPSRNPELSDYISRLTGITTEMIAQHGVPFGSALGLFSEFIGKDVPVLVNGADGLVLRENCELNGLENVLDSRRFFNFRPALARAMGREPAGLMSSQLPSMLGLDEPENKHSGLGDARAIALAFRELRRRNVI